ncbi:unnamed protein product [Ilex paraguariensis]|uniref:Uncharacterized protein n=1 Tax=Ilex paraguariensis TaxID=185542 RepID=A0ABC8V080_9AQUA
MRRRPFVRRKQYTRAPTGHSTIAVATNARNPSVGPNTLHRQGLLVVPHCTHIGNTMTVRVCVCFYVIIFGLSVEELQRFKEEEDEELQGVYQTKHEECGG